MSNMGTHAGTARHSFRRGVVTASIIAIAWGLSACSSGASEADYGGTDAGGEPGVEAEAGTDLQSSAEQPTQDRSLIITGEMYMTVEDPLQAADRAESIVQGAGGRVDARSETAATEYGGGSAHLTLRIPGSALDRAVDDLRALGTVDEFSTHSSDVTVEVTDLAARISTLRASTLRIEGLLAEAQGIKDIIALEDELASRQAELEGLEARQRGLEDQVAMSAIDLSLTTEPVVIVEDDSPRTFWTGLESGWDGLVTFVTGALVVLGVLLPWLAAAAVVGGVVVVAVRVARSRRTPEASGASGASDASAASETPVPDDAPRA
ncbi:hypothetical protein Lsed01_00869 [Demequina sediminis]|uniref:DUF4349 domain-containing protein n=2 Tax=Demequina sediminis TaxID=1930058 RepID=A0ABP9WF34_9MICO